MTRLIWTGVVVLPTGEIAEVLVNLYPRGNQDRTLEVALRADSHHTWGLPAVLTFEGFDPQPPENHR